MLNKKKIQKKISTGVIIGFIIGFALVFKQLIASFISILSNEYLQYRMFRLIALSFQDSIYKWLIVSIVVSFIFIIIGSLWEFLFSVKHKGRGRAKLTLKIIIITIGYLILFFLTQKSMNLPGLFHPISVSVYMGLFLFTAFLWWIFTKTRWWKLLTRSRINTIKRRVYISIFVIAVAYVVISISDRLYAPKGPNIVLIGIDTLRADHLGCYMYARETSPKIDMLAKKGILFSKCISHIPITTPSFSSLFTSKRPISHGVLDNNYNNYKLDDWHVTLSEVLKNRGYNTAAFVSGWTMKKNANLTQGFNVYNDDFEKDRKAEKVNQQVFRWLEKNKHERFFLFIHYFDPHGIYLPDPPYDRHFNYTTEEGDISKIPDYQRHGTIADPSYYIAQYDGEIRYTDYHVGQVLEKLSQLGLDDKTMLIITADHGETMAEHLRWFDHGNFLYEEQVHVPLIIWYPQMWQPKKINTLVRHMDIFPTILDFLGINFSKNMEGQSLLPLIRGEVVKDKVIYLESAPSDPKIHINVIKGIHGKQFAIRSNEWKLIRTLKTTGLYYELYNLNEDPKELYNRIGTNPAMEDLLKEKLEKFVKIYKSSPYYLKRTSAPPPKEKIEDKELKEILKSLGYIR